MFFAFRVFLRRMPTPRSSGRTPKGLSVGSLVERSIKIPAVSMVSMPTQGGFVMWWELLVIVLEKRFCLFVGTG